MKNKIRTQELCVGLILLIVGILSFVYWGNQKEVWFCDEIYSYESANGIEQDWPASNKGVWMTGKDVEAYFAADIDYLLLDNISARLYNDHVPLYFWLFRMVSMFLFKGSGTIWIGLTLNLFFYLIVLAVGYKLFVRLTGNVFVAGSVMLVTGVVNRLMLNQATTLRMYMMLLWGELFLILAGLWILQNLEKDKMSAGVFVFLFVVSTAGLLTHYHYWVFYAITAALFCVWILILAMRKGRKAFWRSIEFRYVLAWVGNFAASLCVTTILFPYCKWNLNRGKGQTALHSVFVFNREKWENICWGYHRLVASIFGENIPTVLGLVVIFGCIACGAIILYRRNEKVKLSGLVLVTMVAQAYQLIVCFTLPDAQEERYLWGGFTLIMWCLCYSLFLLLRRLFAGLRDEKMNHRLGWVAGTVLTLCCLWGQFRVIDGGNGVAYLFHPQKDVALLDAHSEEAWVVYGPTIGVYSYYDWLKPERICFVSHEKTEADARAILELMEDDQFILYTHENYLPEALEFFEQVLGKELSGEYLTKSTNLTVYTIEVSK